MSRIKSARPVVDEEELAAVVAALRSGQHAAGEALRAFEDQLRARAGAAHVRATSSGTTALHLALLGLGVGPGDEVVLPSYVCQSVLAAVLQCGATPRLADLQDDFAQRGYNLDAASVERRLSAKTAAVIVPHLFGVPADLGALGELRVPLVEDCAQALGASCAGRPAGATGTVAVFSFYAGKVISTGQGGGVATSDPEVARRIDALMRYDERAQAGLAYNYALTNLQAALGLAQLRKLDAFLARRRSLGERYDAAFAGLGATRLPRGEGFPFRYLLKFSSQARRDRVAEALRAAGISHSRGGVFRPLHRDLGLRARDFPNTEAAFATSLGLPCHPALGAGEVEEIVRVVQASC